ncbi:MAG: hypothetical protein ACTSRG_27145 [Candidatus Helarchaeota archaeon]
MQEGRCNALSNLLNRLIENINASACLIVDERGLLISEYIKTKIDKNAMATMSSLLSGTSNRFINPLKLKKLNSVIINTSKGIILIKEVPIIQLDRKFTLSVLIEKDQVKSRKKSKKKQGRLRVYIRKILDNSSFKKNNGFNTKLLRNIEETVIGIQKIFNS